MKTSYLLVDRILSQLLPHGREREGRIVLPAPESCLGLLERDWLILKLKFFTHRKTKLLKLVILNWFSWRELQAPESSVEQVPERCNTA